MKIFSVINSSIFIFLFFFATTSCAGKETAKTEYVLGTICTINLYDKGTPALYNELFSHLRELEAILSANRENSNIADINRAAGLHPIKAAPETMEILEKALWYSEKTKGSFDTSIGPLVKLWNIGTDYAAVPSHERIEETMTLVDWHAIAIDKSAGTVFLKNKGMKLDFGAIAKGYAADEMARIIARHGIKRAMIDLGGNIYSVGEKSLGRPWIIGIRNPEETRGDSIISLPVSDKSVVTSGIYERFFEENGIKYHHILDPQTGYPAVNELVSVTIVSPISIDADALSTSAFLLGIKEGLKLIKEIPDTDAVFINKKREIYITPGLRNKIKILDGRFILMDY